VQLDVQAAPLQPVIGAQRQDERDQLQESPGGGAGVEEGGDDGDRLLAEECRVALEQPPFSQAALARTPVRSAPVSPPRPCAATTSSESSRRVRER
jgi:hypothetical protein